MGFSFTPFIETLAKGDEPADSAVDAVLREIRSILVRELRRRLLWNRPPTWLGIFGYVHWDDAEDGRSVFRGPLGELALDALSFSVFDRLEALINALATKPNVDGLVIRNIYSFVSERQRNHDSLGPRIFNTLREVCRRAVGVGSMVVVDGDDNISHSTVLGRSGQRDGEIASEEHLESIVDGWIDQLMPALVIAEGRGREPVLLKLQQLVLGLRDHDFALFRFGHLAAGLIRSARARWLGVGRAEAGEVALEQQDDTVLPTLVRVVRPESGFEQRQDYEQLISCVKKSLEQEAMDRRSKSHLHRLWQFLQAAVVELDDGERFPSNREIARRLEIPRNRISDLRKTLAELIERCRKGGSP